MENILKKFKRASAGALAAAVIALGTSCGYVPAVETTATTAPIVTEPTVTDKVTIADIENIKPVYNQNIVSADLVNATLELNNTIKTMINNKEYYGNNFTYLVERLTITNIGVEAYNAEEEVNTDYAPTNKAKVTITYDADVVDKQTAEKSTVTNTISYVVEDEKVASLANQENVGYTELTKAVNAATEEKLEEIETTGTQATKEDEVTSRQSIITDRLTSIVITDELLNDYYSQDFIQEYLNNGYHLITSIEHMNTTQTRASLRENGSDYFIYNTPTISAYFQKQPWGIETTLNFYFVTLAVNDETGDKKLITTTCNRKTTTPIEIYENMKALALEHAYFDPYALLQQAIEMQGTGQGAYWSGIICGSEPFTEKFYSTVQNLVDNYNFELYIPLDRDLVIKDANNVNNYEDAKRVMALTDENNTNVYIKEANNELDK